jgi:hypothetical protein
MFSRETLWRASRDGSHHRAGRNAEDGRDHRIGSQRPANGPAPEKRYTLTFSVNIQNLLNHANLTNHVGNLSSPRLGESLSSAGSFGFGPSGSAAAGNRRIQVQVRLGFQSWTTRILSTYSLERGLGLPARGVPE